jgi:LPXTG-motif cell wall-anchored protein
MYACLRAVGAASLLVAAALAIPSTAAYAADDDKPVLTALPERDATGAIVVYPIHQGESIPILLGVANVGPAPAAGVVVRINTINDVDLPRTFSNCLYYVDSNKEGAYCSLAQDLPARSGSYALAGFQVAAAPDAKADRLPGILFEWFSKAEIDARGGVAALAQQESGQGTTPVAGKDGTLRLEPKEMFISPQATRLAFAYEKLATTPPTSPPASSPTATPTSAPTSSSAPPAAGSGSGLPVTGAKAATFAGAGAALLIAGVVGLLIARRRRTRFLA